MTRYGDEARDLRIIVIDDGNVKYSGAYPQLEVVNFGGGLSRIGTWHGLVALLIDDEIPDFDLLLYDVNFDKDRSLSKAGDDPLDSGGVRTLGMVMALAVLAGRSPSSGMPIAQSAFSAFGGLLVNDRGAIHTYGLLRALEDEPPDGIEADQVSKVLPGAVVEGIRRDLGRITTISTKDPSPSHKDLIQIMPSYRKHFLGRCDKAIIALDATALSEALAILRSIPPETTQESTELDQIVLVVSHASGEEVLRFRSLFAERPRITGGDLFLKGEGFDYNAYHRDNETIDHAELGPGDFLELLRVVTAQHRPLHPVVSQLMASIREARELEESNPRAADREHHYFHEKWSAVCDLRGITDRSRKNEVAFVALLFAHLEYLHAHATNRPHDPRVVTAIRQALSSNEAFPRNYLHSEYGGGYRDIILAEFKKGRLRPNHRTAGIDYWDELNTRYGMGADRPDYLR